MPLVGMHLRAARDIIARWRSEGRAPFDVDDHRSRGAFLHGSLGPDKGFFPGGVGRLSELAHTTRSGDLTRALHAHARSDAEIAFAFGWCTHVLLDAHVHPLINRRAADLSGRSRLTPPKQLLHMHQRLEMGLDIALQRTDPCSASDMLSFMRDARFVIEAYEAVYGYRFTVGAVVASHRAVARWTGPLLALESVFAASTGGDPSRPEGAGTQRMALAGVEGLRLLTTIVSRPEASAIAFLRPIEPDVEFKAEMQQAVARFHDEFHSHVTSGLATLPNYNLDDGTLMEASAHTAVA